jgi:hypothetical protein
VKDLGRGDLVKNDHNWDTVERDVSLAQHLTIDTTHVTGRKEERAENTVPAEGFVARLG